MNIKFLHQNTDERIKMILHGNIIKTLIMLSIPTLMLTIVQSMMPLMDGLFINNISGTLVASAVTYGAPIINMTIALAQGLSVAAMAIIGQMSGSGNYEKVKKINSQIFIFSFILGIVIAPILAILAIPISKGVSADISQNVFTYISLYSIVIPFSFIESVYNAIKNATGKPEATLIRMVLMLILKTIFNFVFIAWLRLGIVGSVLSSLCANFIICFWMFYELFLKKSDDKLTFTGLKFDWQVIKNLIIIGVPAMLTHIMLNLGFYLINNEILKYGAIVLNGQGIAGNISGVCFGLPASFGASVTTMVSMNIGAKQVDKAKKSCFYGTILSVITAIFIISIIIPLTSLITTRFTNDTEVLRIANESLNIYIYSVIGFGICMVQQGAFIGLGKTKIPFILGILRIWFLRYIFIIATEQFLSFYSVFWGNLFSNYAAAIISTIIILKIKWNSTLDIAENNLPVTRTQDCKHTTKKSC